MSARRIVQVCPPGGGGVRDFAERLAHAWRAAGDASALLEAAEPGPGGARLGERLAALAGDAPLVVVLHFSGYGYARRGLCGWLVDELAALRTRLGARLRLVVVFHELFAGGAPWRSAFWLAPLQARVARRLARLADALWTNTAHHAGLLRDAVGTTMPIVTQPVFSNVGEPAALPDWSARTTHAVLFGSRATRERAVAALRGREARLAALGIVGLVEAGSGDACAAALALPVRHVGALAPAALSALLLRARFGVLDYPTAYLGKSGVFAAYAAHGCVAVDTAGGPASDGLVAGEHFLALAAPSVPSPAALGAISGRAAAWYAPHALAAQAAALRLLMLTAP